MSSTIDERVVEMKFDNSDFEKNVKTSLNTIDKLNDKLDMKGASDGVSKLSKSIKQFTMEPMEKAVDSCKLKFSGLQIAAATAVANITNDIVNKSKQILSEFTIQPISSGFDEYELKMGSVQTIMASTGASVEEVNKYLNDLNTYSDRTIYSFQDMTSNIGKFTNAGVGLEEAVNAIKGISNEAALSGANAEEASRAMYNFSQALSAGYVKLIDWKSIENANMATVGFKEQLLETAEACGTVTKNADGMYTVVTTNANGASMKESIDATHNFNDSLAYQWMTSEVLTKTLAKYSDETTDIGKKAYAAAEDVKTFSMMMDTLKEAAQSGWAQTSEILFGNFEEAKHTWTTLADYFSDAISGIDNARNKYLGGAFMSTYDKIIDKMNKAGISTDQFTEKFKQNAIDAGVDVDGLVEKYGTLGDAVAHNSQLQDIFKSSFKEFTSVFGTGSKKIADGTEVSTDKLSEFQEVANQVIRGDFGNGEERVKALTEAGYDYQTIQDLVNKTLGVGATETTNLADTVNSLSDEELENMGYTEDQIQALRDLAKEARTSGTDMNTLLDQLDQRSGREILLSAVLASLDAMKSALGDIKLAWKDVFGEPDSSGLYSFLKDVEKIAIKIRNVVKRNGVNITKTFRGIFSVLDIGKQILGGVVDLVKRAFGGLSDAVSSTGFNFFEFTGKIGDNIAAFDEWLKQNKVVDKVVTSICTLFEMTTNAVKGLISTIKDSKAFKVFSDVLGDIGEKISGIFGKGANSLGKNPFIQILTKRFANFIKALTSGDAKKATTWLKLTGESLKTLASGGFHKVIGKIGTAISDVYKKLDGFFGITDKLNAFKSTKLYSSFSGFVDDIKEKISSIFSADSTKLQLPQWLEAIKKAFSNFDFSDILGSLGKVFSSIKEAGQERFGDVFSKIGEGIDKFKQAFSGSNIISFDSIIEGIKGFFGSLKDGISANTSGKGGGIVSGLQTFWKGFSGVISDIGKFIKDNKGTLIAIGIFVANAIFIFKTVQALMPLVAPFKSIASSFGDIASGFAKKYKGEGIKAFAEGVAILAGSIAGLALLVKFDWKATLVAFGMIAALIVLFALVSHQTSKIDFKALGNIIKGGTILAFAAGVLLIATAIAKIAKIDPDRLAVASLVVGGIMIFLAFAQRILPKLGEAEKIGSNAGTFIGMAVAIYLIAVAVKKLSKIDTQDLIKAGLVITVLMIVMPLMEVASKNVKAGAGVGLILMAGSLLVLTTVLKKLADISTEEIAKSLTNYIIIFVIMLSLMIVAKIAGERAKAGAVSLLLMSATILILAHVIEQLSSLSLSEIRRGLSAIAGIELLLIAFMAVTKSIKSSMSASDMLKMSATLIVMSAALAILAAVVILLGNIKTEKLVKGLVVTAILVALVDSMVFVSSKCKGISSDMFKPMIAIVAMLVVLIAAIIVLTLIPVKKLAVSVLAVISVVSAVALLLAAMSKWTENTSISLKSIFEVILILGAVLGVVEILNLIGVKAETAKYGATAVGIIMIAVSASFLIMSKMHNDISVSMKSIGEVLILLAAVSAVIFLLTKFGSNLDQALYAASSVGLLMLALSGSFVIMSNALPTNSVNIKSISDMLVLLAGVSAAIFLLTKFGSNLDQAIPVAAAISLLMVALGVSFRLIGSIGVVASSALVNIGLMLLLLAGISTIFGILISNSSNLDKALPVATALSEMMLAMAAAFAIIAVVSPLASAASSAIVPMLAVFGVDTGVIALLGLLSQIPGFEGIVDTGLEVMDKLATGLGTAFYDFINAAAPDIVTAIQNAATGISTFADDLSGFMSAMGSENGSTIVSNASQIAQAVLYFAQADFLEGVASIFGQKSAIEAFSKELPTLAEALAGLSGYNIDSEKATVVADTLQALADVQLDKKGGLVGAIMGNEMDLDDFAKQLPKVAEALSGFSSRLGNVTIDTDTAKKCADILSAFGSVTLPTDTEGTLIGVIAGNKVDISTFAEKLPDIASNLSLFSSNLGTTSISSDTAQACADVLSAFGKAEMPSDTSGSLIGAIVGGKVDIQTFAKKLPGIAESLASYSSQMEGLTISSDSASAVVDFIETFAGADIDYESNFWTGNAKISEFVGYLPDIGSNIKDFSDNIKGATAGSSALLSAIVDTFIRLADRYGNINSNGGGTFTEFIGNMAGTASDISTFSSNMSGVSSDSGSKFISIVGAFVSAAGRYGNINSSGGGTFKEFIGNMAATGDDIKGFSDDMSGADSSVGATFSAIVSSFIRMAKRQASLSDSGSNLTDLISTLSQSGSGLASFISSFSGIDTTGVSQAATAVSSIIGSLRSLSSSINDNTLLDSSTISTLTSSIDSLVASFNGISSIDITGVTSGTAAITQSLSSMSSAASNVDMSGVVSKVQLSSSDTSSAKSSFSKFGSDLISSLSSGLSKGSGGVTLAVRHIITAAQAVITNYNSRFASIGRILIANLANGIKSGNASSAAGAVASRANSAVRSYYNSFYNSGYYLVTGFANGISSYTYLAAARAAAMARAAKDRANSEIKIGSPSKVMYQSGKWFVEGFANGIKQATYMSASASRDMADESLDAFSSVLSSVSDMADTDLSLDPVITPVVDMSNVTESANRVSSLLDIAPTVRYASTIQPVRGNATQRVMADFYKNFANSQNGSNNTYEINISVDGAENPEDYALRLGRSLKQIAQMGGI